MSKNDLYPLSDRILRLPDVIKATGIGRSYIYVLMKKGKFPKKFPIEGSAVGWSAQAVNEWIAERVNGAKK